MGNCCATTSPPSSVSKRGKKKKKKGEDLRVESSAACSHATDLSSSASASPSASASSPRSSGGSDAAAATDAPTPPPGVVAPAVVAGTTTTANHRVAIADGSRKTKEAIHQVLAHAQGGDGRAGDGRAGVRRSTNPLVVVPTSIVETATTGTTTTTAGTPLPPLDVFDVMTPNSTRTDGGANVSCGATTPGRKSGGTAASLTSAATSHSRAGEDAVSGSSNTAGGILLLTDAASDALAATGRCTFGSTSSASMSNSCRYYRRGPLLKPGQRTGTDFLAKKSRLLSTYDGRWRLLGRLRNEHCGDDDFGDIGGGGGSSSAGSAVHHQNHRCVVGSSMEERRAVRLSELAKHSAAVVAHFTAANDPTSTACSCAFGDGDIDSSVCSANAKQQRQLLSIDDRGDFFFTHNSNNQPSQPAEGQPMDGPLLLLNFSGGGGGGDRTFGEVRTFQPLEESIAAAVAAAAAAGGTSATSQTNSSSSPPWHYQRRRSKQSSRNGSSEGLTGSATMATAEQNGISSSLLRPALLTPAKREALQRKPQEHKECEAEAEAESEEAPDFGRCELIPFARPVFNLLSPKLLSSSSNSLSSLCPELAAPSSAHHVSSPSNRDETTGNVDVCTTSADADNASVDPWVAYDVGHRLYSAVRGIPVHAQIAAVALQMRELARDIIILDVNKMGHNYFPRTSIGHVQATNKAFESRPGATSHGGRGERTAVSLRGESKPPKMAPRFNFLADVEPVARLYLLSSASPSKIAAAASVRGRHNSDNSSSETGNDVEHGEREGTKLSSSFSHSSPAAHHRGPPKYYSFGDVPLELEETEVEAAALKTLQNVDLLHRELLLQLQYCVLLLGKVMLVCPQRLLYHNLGGGAASSTIDDDDDDDDDDD